MYLSPKEVERLSNSTGEVDCLKWRNVLFRWTEFSEGRDLYQAHGAFLGIRPGIIYETLTIAVDYSKNKFDLWTGTGKEVTVINLLGI